MPVKLANLPYWVAISLAGGGTLVTTFANQLPNQVQFWGFLFGVAMIAVGFTGGALHFFKSWRKAGAPRNSDVHVVNIEPDSSSHITDYLYVWHIYRLKIKLSKSDNNWNDRVTVWIVDSDKKTLKQYVQSKLNISNVGVDEIVVDIFRIAPARLSPDSLFLMTPEFICFTDKTYREIHLNGRPSNTYTGKQMGLFSREAIVFTVQVMIDDKEIKKQKFKIQPKGEGVELLAGDVC